MKLCIICKICRRNRSRMGEATSGMMSIAYRGACHQARIRATRWLTMTRGEAAAYWIPRMTALVAEIERG